MFEQILDQIEVTQGSKTHKGKEQSVFDILYGDLKHDLDGVSLMTAFKIEEIRLLILSGAFHCTATRILFRFSKVFENYGVTESVESLEQQTRFYVGTAIGSLIAALFYVTVFRRKHYLLIVFLNSIGIASSVFEASLNHVSTQITEETGTESPFRKFLFNGQIGWFDFVWGIYEGFGSFILIFLLPAILAMKSRRTYELTMAGSILGIIVALTFLLSQFIYYLIWMVFDDLFSELIEKSSGANFRLIVACLLWFSSLPFLRIAYHEYYQIVEMKINEARLEEARKWRESRSSNRASAGVPQNSRCLCCKKFFKLDPGTKNRRKKYFDMSAEEAE